MAPLSTLQTDHQPSLPHQRLAFYLWQQSRALGLSACGAQNTSTGTTATATGKGILHRRRSSQRGQQQVTVKASAASQALPQAAPRRKRCLTVSGAVVLGIATNANGIATVNGANGVRRDRRHSSNAAVDRLGSAPLQRLTKAGESAGIQNSEQHLR